MQALICGKTLSILKHKFPAMVIRRDVQTVGAAMEKWKTIFCQENVPEPTSSVRNIMSQIFKLRNV